MAKLFHPLQIKEIWGGGGLLYLVLVSKIELKLKILLNFIKIYYICGVI